MITIAPKHTPESPKLHSQYQKKISRPHAPDTPSDIPAAVCIPTPPIL